MSTYKLGSLFDGSGGFPLAGAMCGITPVWAAEIEPYPIAVTSSRFPAMKHLGDISKINGAQIDPVDIITFGSPCQDLSVAGKRAGLKHTENGDEETTRSGLFMEAVRIIKEMREATGGKYPRWALWENVPGAFSSNKGEDFRVVCEEIIKIAEPNAVMPAVPQFGWPYADSYRGDGWSLAYRVLDAQYWGVPQRRRRIYLVADFGGECAREVLFEREGLRGYFTQGRTPWESTAGNAENSTGADDREGDSVEPIAVATQQGGAEVSENGICPTLTAAAGMSGNNQPWICLEPGIAAREGGHMYEGVSGTLRANAGDNQMAVAYSFDPLASNSMKSKNPHSGCRQVEVARCLDTTDPNPSKNQGGIAIVEPVGFDGYNSAETGSKAATLGVNCGVSTGRNGVVEPVGLIDSIGGQAERGWEGDKAPCLKASHYKMAPCVAVSAGFCPEVSADARGVGYAEEQAPTLRAGVVPAICATYDARGNGDGKVCNTITGDHNNRITDYTTVLCEPTFCLQGNGIDRADTAGCNGKGVREEVCYTLNTIDRPAVAFRTYQQVTGPLMANSHPGSYTGQDAFSDMLVAGLAPHQETVGALCARDYKGVGSQYVDEGKVIVAGEQAVHIRYIVRRLTPTECARLQGFADNWGHLEPKSDFSDAEYRFWLEVRNTHAAINGRAVKEYTKAQMLNWYNKLHTDSSEYKMWGNGIALPTALYVMQGIAERMNTND